MEGGGFIVEDDAPAQPPSRPDPTARRVYGADDAVVYPGLTNVATVSLLSGGRNASGCEKCGSLTYSQEWYSVFGVIICNQCKREEKLITKTTAKEVYLVSDKDLQGLGSLSKSNPQHKQWTAMKLYLESQVRQASMQKYGSVEKLDEERQKRIDAKLAKRVKRRREEQEQERKDQQQQQRLMDLMDQQKRQQQQESRVHKKSVLDERTGEYKEVYAVGETEVDVEEI